MTEQPPVQPPAADGAPAEPPAQPPADRPPVEPPADRPPRPRFATRPVVRAPEDERPVRQVSHDETDVGWGDAPGKRDDDWYRRERPPHHG